MRIFIKEVKKGKILIKLDYSFQKSHMLPFLLMFYAKVTLIG